MGRGPRKPILDEGDIFTIHGAVTDGGTRRLVVGESYGGATRWAYADGSPAGSVGYAVCLHEEGAGVLVLTYAFGERDTQQAFAVVGLPCRFGGRRWFALCPQTARPVAKLYGGRGMFSTRHEAGASYRSQDRMWATDRLRVRERALLRRLGTSFEAGAYIAPPKPKWMRWPTYSRLALELQDVRLAYATAFTREVDVMMGRRATEPASALPLTPAARPTCASPSDGLRRGLPRSPGSSARSARGSSRRSGRA